TISSSSRSTARKSLVWPPLPRPSRQGGRGSALDRLGQVCLRPLAHAPVASDRAAVYFLQVALAHAIWSVASPRGHGIAIGLLQAAVFTTAAALAFRARSQFPRRLD